MNIMIYDISEVLIGLDASYHNISLATDLTKMEHDMLHKKNEGLLFLDVVRSKKGVVLCYSSSRVSRCIQDNKFKKGSNNESTIITVRTYLLFVCMLFHCTVQYLHNNNDVLASKKCNIF